MKKILLGFPFFVFFIIVITSIIFIINNYSEIAYTHFAEQTAENSTAVSNALYEAENDFAVYKNIVEDLYHAEPDISRLSASIHVTLKRFTSDHPQVESYFFKLNESEYNDETSQNSELLEPLFIYGTNELETKLQANMQSQWITIGDTDITKNKIFLAYVSPIMDNGVYIGFLGVNIDLKYISDLLAINSDIDINSEAKSADYAALLSSSAEILVHPNEKPGQLFQSIENARFKDFITVMLNSGRKSGSLNYVFDSNAWIASYSLLPTGQYYVENGLRSHKEIDSNILILLLAVFAIVAVSLVNKVNKNNETTFDIITKKFLPDNLNSSRAAIGLFLGMNWAFFAYIIYQAVTDFHLIRFLAYIVVITLSMFLLFLYRFSKNKKIVISLFVVVTMLFPFAIHLLSGGFSGGSAAESIMWTIISVPIVLFIAGKQVARQLMKYFIFLLFSEVLIEIYLFKSVEFGKIYTVITGLFFLGFSLYNAIEIYVTRSTKDHEDIVNLYKKLQDTQSYVVQKEKMAMLGRIIAGVAHEINTPIGAIKASSETLTNTLKDVISRISKECAQFTSEDFDNLFILIEMANESISQMYSTTEVRRAKPKLKAYFCELGIADYEQMVNNLTRMEIIDLEKIEKNEAVFLKDNSQQLIQLMCYLSPYINSAKTISVAAEKVTKIVFALKSYSHTSVSNEPEEVDIVKNIENVLVIYNNLLKKGISVTRDYDENLPYVKANSDEMSQVWSNLIHNAIYAMSTTGELLISVQIEGNYIVALIKDTGCGIKKEDFDSLFDAFYTTKPVGEGSGLGLNISKKIVESHNGIIEIKSEVGIGTTVTVKLPV